jgi:hypothetical protein
MKTFCAFSIAALGEVVWSASRPDTLSPGKEPLVPLGGWVGPRASLGAVVKGKKSLLFREGKPDRPARNLDGTLR